MKKNTKITIADIAGKAGVSTCTVSRVINKKDLKKVSAQVKQKVLKVIADYNFKPDNAAKSLASGKSSLIGVILPGINSPSTHSNIINSMEIETLEKNYGVILGISDWEEKREKELTDLMLEKGVDGIIWMYNGIEPEKQIIKNIHRKNKALLYLLKETEAGPYVVIDQEEGGYIATKYLIKSGHEHIAFMGPVKSSDQHAKDRLKGYKKALKKYNLKKGLISNANYRFAEAYEETCRIIMENKKFTAIFAASDEIAMGAYKALRKNNYRIGKDMALMGYGNNNFGKMLDVPLTSISINPEKAGSYAVKNLISMINGEKIGNIKIKPIISPGESCGE